MTLLTLEALDADDGDCLLLHHGSAAEPAHILIDGGRKKVFTNALRPRLEELRDRHELGSTETLPIELAVLTHVDADHIAGLLALTRELVDAKESDDPLPWQICELWLNGFNRKVGDDEAATIQSLAKDKPTEIQAMAASVQQGLDLDDDADRLGIPVNSEFERFVARPDDAVMELPWDDLKITVLAPSVTQMKAFEREWDAALQAMLRDEQPSPNAAAINGASVVLLVEPTRGEGRRILLTGDAYSEHIIAGLEIAGMLDGGAPFLVDILKVPHHGAEGNCSLALFEKVHARHYVISANGQHHNPDNATLDRLWQARGADCADWTLHVTFAADEVPAFRAWCEAHPGIQIEHRAAGARRISIELGDEHL